MKKIYKRLSIVLTCFLLTAGTVRAGFADDFFCDTEGAAENLYEFFPAQEDADIRCDGLEDLIAEDPAAEDDYAEGPAAEDIFTEDAVLEDACTGEDIFAGDLAQEDAIEEELTEEDVLVEDLETEEAFPEEEPFCDSTSLLDAYTVSEWHIEQVNPYYADEEVPAEIAADESEIPTMDTVPAEPAPAAGERQETVGETLQEVQELEAEHAAVQTAAADMSSDEQMPLMGDAQQYEQIVELLSAGAASGYYTSAASVGQLIRGKMSGRESFFTFNYAGSSLTKEKLTSILNNAFIKAVEHTGNPSQGDYLAYGYYGWRVSASSVRKSGSQDRVSITMQIVYYTTAAQETEMNSLVSQALSAVRAKLPGNASEYQKIREIYRYVTQNIYYAENETSCLQFTAYAGLKYHTCVCQGFATLLYRLLLAEGIDNRIIVSNPAGGNGHAWNIIRLGSRYYNADATWDCRSYGICSSSYFLKGEGAFRDGNHEPWASSDRGTSFTSAAFQRTYPISGTNYTTAEKDCYAGGHNFCKHVLREATVFAQEAYCMRCRGCGCIDCNGSQNGIRYGSRAKAYIKLNVSGTIPMKTGQVYNGVKVDGKGNGDYVYQKYTSNSSIVSFTKSGALKAGKKTGTATVTVIMRSGVSASFRVKVQRKVGVSKIRNVASKLTMKKGQKCTLMPKLAPVTARAEITYSSSARKIVSVSSKGVLTARKKGTAVITVKAGGKKVKCRVTVR